MFLCLLQQAVRLSLVDARRGQLVWEAIGKGRVSQQDLASLEESVNEDVPRYFEHFPFKAGDGVPNEEG